MGVFSKYMEGTVGKWHQNSLIIQEFVRKGYTRARVCEYVCVQERNSYFYIFEVQGRFSEYKSTDLFHI